MHGCGVSVPAAAALAATTWGFNGDWHMPKGAMFTMGFMSCTVAAGANVPKETPLIGSTVSVDGKLPIEHASVAP